MTVATDPPIRADVIRPSELGAAETTAWRGMQAKLPSLQRAFFTPTFAQACERAHGRAYVAVLHTNSTIQAFLPFQFKSVWHERIRLAEHIGGVMAQGSCLIAAPGFQIDPASLLRLAGLASLFMSQLMQGQELFGLDASWSQRGHVTDLHDGADAYAAALLVRDRPLVRDTERCLRKADKDYGRLQLAQPSPAPPDMLAALIAEKRQQYQRTEAGDPFTEPENLRLLDILNEMPNPDCQLAISQLTAGDRVLARHLGLRHHDVLSYWIPVYDPDARNVSPGRLLLWHLIQQAKQDGITLIDYGEGDAVYKRELATGSLRYGRAGWSSGGARSVVARIWQSLEWRMRRRQQRTRNMATEQV
jgi:CelD/BcsL family acetyltransferase involved in cellulose biosynthesis